MLGYVVLHDSIVTMGVNANVRVMGETEVHDTAEYTMSIWVTGYAVDYMIRAFIIKPLAVIDSGISWFRGRKKSKVTDYFSLVFNNIATTLFHVGHDDCFRRIAVSPLVHVAGLSHYLLRGIHDQHNL